MLNYWDHSSPSAPSYFFDVNIKVFRFRNDLSDKDRLITFLNCRLICRLISPQLKNQTTSLILL